MLLRPTLERKKLWYPIPQKLVCLQCALDVMHLKTPLAGSHTSLSSTPKKRSTEIPTFQDQSNVGTTLPKTTCIEFSDSEIDILPVALPNEAGSQGSRDAPIVIDSSPVKPADDNMEEDPIPKPQRPLHPFFAPRVKPQNLDTKTSPKRHHTKDIAAAYPDRESQHVKGSQSSYPSPPCPFARRSVPPSSGTFQPLGHDHVPVLDFLLPQKQIEDPHGDAILPVTESNVHIASINQTHIQEHPAIARVVDVATSSAPSTSSTQLWTESWRPRCAKEVLGNEHSAIYLRNWLHTLALQLDPTRPQDSNKKKRKRRSKKRPRVVREVPRKKPRKAGLDGFVVDDDEEDDAYHSTPNWGFDDDLMLDGSSQNSALGDERAFASDVPETINGPLHNTILLTGPPGSGKTAAVFACAEELGWEVFEVYPGIGRRNGANVDNLVGDVGKNHLVRTRKGATPQPSIATLLSSGAGSSEAGAEGDGQGSDVALLDGQGDLASTQAGGAEQAFRQSLILLEEVDLLFKDDVNFWPAVTNLIKDCRRPVICTCNGKFPDRLARASYN